ncbi:hypothetical protein SAMN05421642_1382 [Rhodococcoides kyotonense]|uniref:Uncharacterized protein n=1 Tax=Rhodococcoides kyotonense TaxID=398843 RepID=A0A239NFF5_9NOCA|nr:hypothetical protein SAMN05421642_1382 [Rhodococcus kyotonensis]
MGCKGSDTRASIALTLVVALFAMLAAAGSVIGVCFLATHTAQSDRAPMTAVDIFVLMLVLVSELMAIVLGTIVAMRHRGGAPSVPPPPSPRY